ncbi:endonuclease/exonuclease/phosphatase family protein [Cytobacillus depressus]|uniref:endonuclease/exonuclease/phosphatase family protein n=1 Tax=Cytobacillus depressus TaxID=1602942 RepID=UPI001FE58D76|nr:endonuclease/exonuclease/phosphatase family protein [Cytobacillus depressus]
MEINVITYNIHHGKGIDKQVDLYRIAEVIDKSDADLVGLNEVDKHFSKRSLYEDQISWLANQLNMEHAFSPSISIKSKNSTKVRQYGNALLSRYPIVTKKSHSFNYIPGLVEGRSLLDVAIQINKQLFQVNVTHLSLNPFLHKMQTDFIVSKHNKNPHPIIIMGDWNMRPGSRGWRKLTRSFQDAWYTEGIGAGHTYPSHRPRTRLDYIFVSQNVKVVEAKVLTNMSKASDHLPLTARLLY